jgi:hypothetical protein
MRLDSHALLLATILSTTGIGQVHAQDARAERPFRGLFGGSAGSRDRGQTLDLNWSLLGAYDDNVTADTNSPTDPRFLVKGMYGTVGTSLAYGARGERVSFTATAGSGGRYYPDLSELSAIDANAAVGLSATLGRSVTLRASQGFSYQPYYQFAFLTGLVPSNPNISPSDTNPNISPSDTEAVTSSQSYDYNGHFQVESRLGARSSMTLEYGYRQTQFKDSDGAFAWQLANGRFRHNVTRNAALRLGYGYSEALNTIDTAGPKIVNQIIDAGVDYNRALSFSRRTTLRFGTGSTLTSEGGERHFLFTGSAGLTREIGRTWSATASYDRGIQFIAGFSDQLFADTAQVRVRGLLSRRFELSGAGGYSSGRVGLSASAPHYSTWTGNAGLRFALSRLLSIDTRYFYYRYGFDEGVDLPFGLPSGLNRHGVRIGLTGWLPLYQ